MVVGLSVSVVYIWGINASNFTKLTMVKETKKRTLRKVNFSIYDDQWQDMDDRLVNKSRYVRQLIDDDIARTK